MEAWNARDMEALREAYAEDVVTWPPEGWPEAGPFIGRDLVLRQWERMRELWDEDEVEMRADYVEAAGLGGDRHVHHPQREGPRRRVLLGLRRGARDHRLDRI